MDCIRIDAHVHLWQKQEGMIEGKRVFGLGNGKSMFLDEVRQMMPPYMDDNRNTVERLIANMDYSRVNGAVITQEYMDGDQGEYLLEAKAKYPDRIKICALYRESEDLKTEGFDGIKICAGRLAERDLTAHMQVFKRAEREGLFVGLDLADGDEQTASLSEVIKECPKLRMAIGHFGMVTTEGWEKQIGLACEPNVYIESGGLTWLFNREFYPFPSAVEAVRTAAGICGMEKLMWGSDYPRTMTEITYSMSTRFIEESDRLTIEEKEAYLGKNAERFYGFSFTGPLPVIDNML